MTNTISEEILTKRDFPFNNPFISSSSQFNKDFEQICCNEIGGIKQNFPRNVTSNVHHYNMSAVFFLIYLLWSKSLREKLFQFLTQNMRNHNMIFLITVNTFEDLL